MASMRDIQKRINATRKTSQITKAMHMVSASKLKRAERSIRNFRPLTKRLSASLARILASDPELGHPILEARDVKKTVYILISSDRGLAGPLNANVFKAFEAHIEKTHTSNEAFVVAPLGYKAYAFVKRRGYESVSDALTQVRDDVRFLDFQDICDRFIKDYLSGETDRVVVFYNRFINTLTQSVEQETLIPLEKQPLVSHYKEDEAGPYKRLYLYEPNVGNVLNQLMPMVVVNILYGMILEAKASEHAARMTAMKSATDNAIEVIKELQLKYNRARQDAITIELTDIIGGAEAVK